MALPTWPVNLPDPEAPFDGEVSFPLVANDMGGLGRYETERVKTRAYVNGTLNLLCSIDSPYEVNTFLQFYKGTLNNGVKLFLADWVSTLGYDGHAVKILSYNIVARGVAPLVNMNIQLVPWLKETAGTPNPWPQKVT